MLIYLLVVTTCILNDIKSRGDDYSGAAYVAKRFQRVHCDHENPVSSRECIANILGMLWITFNIYYVSATKSDKYCIASDDTDLKVIIRNTVGAPLIYISRNRLYLEAPSSSYKLEAMKVCNLKRIIFQILLANS
jgi:U3 small nucleolar RNA-associated protein 23